MIDIMRKEKDLPLLGQLFERYHVKIAYLFGSQKDKGIAFLSGESGDIESGSDLDIGVVFEKLPEHIFEVYGDLYADLAMFFEPFDIDLVFLQETEAIFQFEAIKGELIYCESEDFCDDYEEIVMKKASDLSYKRIEFENDFLEAIKDGYFEIAH
jgi:predicted nucleotidyltransferase